jgi:uncharacterized protein YecE (DUF72 family)
MARRLWHARRPCGTALRARRSVTVAAGSIHVGTSGWHYKHWVGPFYPPKTGVGCYLDFYKGRFSAAEINGSFYRMPSLATLAAWREAVPADFRFAAKASRFITHAKKLALPISLYERFFDGIGTLAPKLGPILFQLPPRWRFNADRLATFLDALPRHYRYAFEFREPSWLNEEAYALLRQHGAALCLYHIAGFESPAVVTTDFVYIRLHGPGGKYQGSYDDAALRRWTKSIRAWSREGRSVWCFFDNDDSGHAAKDALRLTRMLARVPAPSTPSSPGNPPPARRG